ncbi:MAG: hypothetical protein Q9216_003442 [Gyalolechia sp. 2 TL-2023]
MPTYAILGATGKTGGALLTLLQKDPNIHINAYARSKSKLLQQHPSLEHNTNVNIFEGSLSDIPLIASTLTHHPPVDAAFCVLGVNENIPGIRIAQDTANAVLAALCHIRAQDPTTTSHSSSPPPPPTPKLIFLSSVSLNPVMLAAEPALAKAILTRGMSHVYADLRFAEETLRLHRSWLKDVTFVQPGGLTEDAQRGHKLSVDGESTGFLSYLDLAAGMIEIAESGTYAWMGVAVVATGEGVRFEAKAPMQILRGLVWHFWPGAYWGLRALGVVS